MTTSASDSRLATFCRPALFGNGPLKRRKAPRLAVGGQTGGLRPSRGYEGGLEDLGDEGVRRGARRNQRRGRSPTG